MSILAVNELKARFEAGDKPSAKDYVDFIDSIQSWIADAFSLVALGAAPQYSSSVILTSHTYAVTYSPTTASPADGMGLIFKADAANPSGGTMLNPDGHGAVHIVREHNIELKAGDIQARQIVEVRYRSTDNVWVMMSPTSHPGLRTGDIVTSAFLLEEDGTRLLCNGQQADITLYPALAILGSTYGAPSDGSHVKLPDYSHRFPVGVGNQTGMTAVAFGDIGGEEKHTLAVGEQGAISLSIGQDDGDAETGDERAINRITMNGVIVKSDLSAGDGVFGPLTVPLNNTAAAHNNMPPFIAAYYYILT